MTRALKRLLAKSSKNEDAPRGAELLRGHTALVVASAKQLLQHRGADALHAVGLDVGLLPRLRRWVLAASFAHDLGKSSDHFQQTVRHDRRAPQLVRHEACSLYLAWPGQPLAAWLGGALEDERELRLVLIAAAGHHRKFWSRAIAANDAAAGTELTLLTSHPDFAHTLELGSKEFGLRPPPTLADLRVECPLRGGVRAFFRDCEEEAEDLALTMQERQLLAVTKALVLDADVAGSALPRSGEKPGWIGEVLARRRDPSDLEAVIDKRLAGEPLRPFQESVATSDAQVTLVRAGCGTGKTVAAYAWAARSFPGRTLWVTYPTTGTTTEGFRDYLDEAPVKGRLDHGRAAVDIDIFGLDEPGTPGRELDRLDALRSWDRDVVTCTVDTVLGLVQNQRKGLYAFASLCRSAVVFDEIHAYDDELFGALLRFLRDVPGVPALLMTASLPEARLRALREVVVARRTGELSVIEGPPDLEQLTRYVRARGEPWNEVTRVLGRAGKVLWVSNTVGRCIGVRDAAPAGCHPLVYHSRFRYEDRVARHGDVIGAFRGTGAALVTTTQVAEMSLDLSADLLVTDLAPIPALIQRLGRLNRRSHPDAPRPVAPFLIVEPASHSPYEEDELDAARAWLEKLGDAPLSQRRLIDAWPSADEAPQRLVRSAWLDGGFHTEAEPLRGAMPGITVVREEDLPHPAVTSSLAARLAIPMNTPRRDAAWKAWRRAAGIYPVAPAGTIDYDAQRGAQWRAAV